jgi:hypothetical protein
VTQLFLRFSGILAMFVAWFFVVGPALHHGIDGKRQTITSATVENKKVARIVGFGLVIGAFLQGLFLFYLIQRFQLHLLSIGSFLYLTSNIATIFVAFCHYSKYPKIHEFYAKYYFVMSPLSLAFIGFSAMKLNSYLFVFSLIVVLLYFFGIWQLIKRFRSDNALLEMWAFFALSIWTIVLTFV